MADIRAVTPQFATAPQLSPADMKEAASLGYVLIINNRPDGEAPGQPASVEMERAAHAAGLAYVHAPFVGAPDVAEVEAVGRAVHAADGPVLAFCRSGTRSITAWAMAQAAEGADRSELARLGAAAGYDLSGSLRADGRG